MTAQAMRELDLGMSNLGSEIDIGFAEALQAEPGQVFGHHWAWNFCGNVWFEDGQFVEAVYRLHMHVDTISAPTLPELMWAVNAKYGDA